MVVVTGSRKWDKPEIIRKVVQDVHIKCGQPAGFRNPHMIVGMASGADMAAVRTARSFHWKVTGFRPDYEKWTGSEAPLRRNDIMVEVARKHMAGGGTVLGLAFPMDHDYSGTLYTMRKFRNVLRYDMVAYPDCPCHGGDMERYRWPLLDDPMLRVVPKRTDEFVGGKRTTAGLLPRPPLKIVERET
jgi:hypothetical protein